MVEGLCLSFSERRDILSQQKGRLFYPGSTDINLILKKKGGSCSHVLVGLLGF